MPLTDRIDNSNLINLARQQFENKQRSKLPSVIVNLSSDGKIYPKSHVLSSGTIEMRYMTAYDEDILTNSSYIREGVVFDKLLESIILTPIDIQDIAEVDKDGLLVHARILAYGADYPVIVTEPNTTTSIERVIDLTKLKNKPFNLIPDENGEFEYVVNDNVTLKFSYITKVTADTKISTLLKQLIQEVNGDRSASRIDDFIKYEFLANESRLFRNFVSSNIPGLDTTYEFEGENGDTFKAKFQLGTDLFWF
jgi:hypothetical protein